MYSELGKVEITAGENEPINLQVASIMTPDKLTRYEPKQLQLTEAQRFADKKFANDVRTRFIVPLVEEFENQIDGYSDMAWYDRHAHVVKLNEPLFGVGDYLPFGGMLVYSGKQIWRKATLISSIVVTQPQPRFFNGQDFRSHFLGEGLFENPVGDIELFLTEEHDEYNELHPSYKAALLFAYIKQKVIVADDMQLIAFILGWSKTLKTSRYSVAQIDDAEYTGWNIRISDSAPDKGFWDKLREVINNGGLLPLEKPKARRKPDPKTELACRYAYELEKSGVVLDARKGGIGYAKVVTDMQYDLGEQVRAYTPDDFGRVYRTWKKKNGLQ